MVTNETLLLTQIIGRENGNFLALQNTQFETAYFRMFIDFWSKSWTCSDISSGEAREIKEKGL
jgi:hypothetical protein